jgi:AGZA family xanthine/uracil permease-like MFS transporter
MEGARSARRLLGAERAFVTLICTTGTLAWIAWAIPSTPADAIVLWIGIVITAQAFQATPREHAPAVVVGMLPGIAGWGALMAKNGLRAAGLGGAAGPFTENLIAEFQKSDTWIHGAFALEQGFLFTAMLLSAAVVEVIERRFTVAAAWCSLAALLSLSGLMHSYQWTFADTALNLARPGPS